MSAPSARQLGAPLYQRMERRVGVLVARMVEAFLEEVPLYRLLPREQLEGEIARITEDNVRIFFHCLREGRPPTEEELAEPRASAARRAEERVPLEAVLSAYHVGARVAWQELVRAAQPEETPALLAAGDAVVTYMQRVTTAVAGAYLEEQQSIYGEERDARRALAQALLSGAPWELPAQRLGVAPPRSVAVLALGLGAHPDEATPGVPGAVAARRKLRRAQSRVDAVSGGAALALLDPAGGMLLLPASGDPDPGAVVAAVADAAAVEVWAAVSLADSAAGVPPAGEQAREVLRIVRLLERPPGCYRLEDVVLEYQLSRASEATPLLTAALDPLERNRDLLHTLGCYFDHDLDRRRTAQALHVHPNTLDYRLRRIAELTGCDLSSARGLQMLGAALAARRLSPR